MTVPAIEAKIEMVLATVQKPSRSIGGEAKRDRQASGGRSRRPLLRRRVRGRSVSGAIFSRASVEVSMLEGALGRGDRRTADIIETAWRGGARYDAWSEHHVEDIWRRAFAAHDRSIEDEATRERDALEPLPWDHVRSGVTKEFLLDEWWASRAERATGDCRFDGCTDCGACSGPVRNRLVS